MEKYPYDGNIKISKFQAFKAAVLIRLAKSWIFPGGRKKLYKMLGVQIGHDVYIGPNLDIISYALGKYLTIKDRAALAPNITFIISSGPNNSKLKSQYPRIFGPITVEEDVWIGSESVILPGLTIGKCSIIGAGSVVTRDIPPYSVAAGNPARIIKKVTECEEILQ